MRRFIAVAAITAAAFAALGLTAGAGATEYEPGDHIVQVTKDFEGDVPDEASFVVEVNCAGTTYSLNFGEEGGTQSVDVGYDTTSCSVSEPDDGGADSVDIDGSPCSFTVTEKPAYTKTETVDTVVTLPPVYEPEPDQVCSVTVTNEFAAPPDVVPPEVIVSPPEIITIPVPVLRTPQFTG